jgi:hypothetical protein
VAPFVRPGGAVLLESLPLLLPTGVTVALPLDAEVITCERRMSEMCGGQVYQATFGSHKGQTPVRRNKQREPTQPKEFTKRDLFLLLWLRIPSGFLVVFEKPNRSSFTFTFTFTPQH